MMQNIFDRLKSVMPAGVEPRFKNSSELLEWHKEQQKLISAKVTAENQTIRLEKMLGRSGIQEIHARCNFDNYLITNPGQAEACRKAQNYANKFGNGFGGFIFSGSVGTGKNHLAAAIGNYLINQGKSVIIVTVPDLMMKFRSTYTEKSNLKEEKLMDELCSVSLLIIDEIGVQRRNSEHENIILNQLVDRRLGRKKPTGMLTNLNYEEMNKFLGPRVMDRMTMGGTVWVNFNWESFRRKQKI